MPNILFKELIANESGVSQSTDCEPKAQHMALNVNPILRDHDNYLLSLIMAKEPKVSDFVQKLYNIMHNENYRHAIGWNEEEIAIFDKDSLVADILPMYFRHSRLDSFVRQLNLYGFRKVSKPYVKECLFFKNDFFKPNRRELLSHIQLKSKERRQEPENVDQPSKISDLKKVTQSREEELERTRANFLNTMNKIYTSVMNWQACNPSLDLYLKDSLLLLKLSGAEDEEDNTPLESTPSINHFFTKVNIQLE